MMKTVWRVVSVCLVLLLCSWCRAKYAGCTEQLLDVQSLPSQDSSPQEQPGDQSHHKGVQGEQGSGSIQPLSEDQGGSQQQELGLTDDQEVEVVTIDPEVEDSEHVQTSHLEDSVAEKEPEGRHEPESDPHAAEPEVEPEDEHLQATQEEQPTAPPEHSPPLTAPELVPFHLSSTPSSVSSGAGETVSHVPMSDPSDADLAMADCEAGETNPFDSALPSLPVVLENTSNVLGKGTKTDIDPPLSQAGQSSAGPAQGINASNMNQGVSSQIATEIEPRVANKDAEDIPTFDEWKKKQMEVEKEKTQASHTSTTSGSNTVKKVQKNFNNYASVECGAKVLGSNPEAKSTSAILMESMDHYMLNPCSNKIWFIIELCDPIQVKQLDIANFELFSSTPKDFLVSISDRFPTNKWVKLGTFHARDERTVQTFPLDEQLYAKYVKMFTKYIKVELLSHHGSEHFCPLSLLRVFGTSMVEEYEEIADPLDRPDDQEDDLDDSPGYVSTGEKDANNLIGSATDVILNMVNNIKVNVLGGGPGEGNFSGLAENITSNPDTNSTISTLIDIVETEQPQVPEHTDDATKENPNPETSTSDTATTEVPDPKSPTVDTATMEDPNTEPPTADTATTENPNMEPLTADTATTENPNMEPTTADTATTEDPNMEPPTADTTTTENPNMEPPTADTATTENPNMEPLTADTTTTKEGKPENLTEEALVFPPKGEEIQPIVTMLEEEEEDEEDEERRGRDEHTGLLQTESLDSCSPSSFPACTCPASFQGHLLHQCPVQRKCANQEREIEPPSVLETTPPSQQLTVSPKDTQNLQEPHLQTLQLKEKEPNPARTADPPLHLPWLDTDPVRTEAEPSTELPILEPSQTSTLPSSTNTPSAATLIVDLPPQTSSKHLAPEAESSKTEEKEKTSWPAPTISTSTSGPVEQIWGAPTEEPEPQPTLVFQIQQMVDPLPDLIQPDQQPPAPSVATVIPTELFDKEPKGEAELVEDILEQPLSRPASSLTPPPSPSSLDYYAELHPPAEPGNGNPMHGSTSQKESVFMRLNNRIKALEMNMSLSGRYLEQLSQRYRRQMEEMQRAFNKTIIKLQNTSTMAEEQDQRQTESIQVLQGQLEDVTQLVLNLSVRVSQLQSQVSDWQSYLLLCVALCVLLCVLVCVQHYRSSVIDPPAPQPPVPKSYSYCCPQRRSSEYEDMSLKRTASYPLLHSDSFQLHPTTEGPELLHYAETQNIPPANKKKKRSKTKSVEPVKSTSLCAPLPSNGMPVCNGSCPGGTTDPNPATRPPSHPALRDPSSEGSSDGSCQLDEPSFCGLAAASCTRLCDSLPQPNSRPRKSSSKRRRSKPACGVVDLLPAPQKHRHTITPSIPVLQHLVGPKELAAGTLGVTAL
ncbi:hypothetical protein UPYG_G00293210 [Umbra pygmaea]|uniref:SUN domain-containing protein n=1 Tax=Umbra pygmaea TaxID=75934 RepID=A0ABD0W6R0_UMBPY